MPVFTSLPAQSAPSILPLFLRPDFRSECHCQKLISIGLKQVSKELELFIHQLVVVSDLTECDMPDEVEMVIRKEKSLEGFILRLISCYHV